MRNEFQRNFIIYALLTFQSHRPKYRYPYYDEAGKGKLLYGYGGPELYQYKTYTPLEGIHWAADNRLVHMSNW